MANKSQSVSASRFTALIAVSAVLFFLSLLPTEIIPEIPVDIDFKPYFIPLLLVALLPVGWPTLAVALGVALGEGLRDLMEGYEIDDPIGFIAYIVGFTVAGYVIGVRPLNKLVLFVGSVVCAAIQGAMEASSFILFGEHGASVALATAIGNTITHGVIMGAIPLLLLVPQLHGRFERYLGFAPKGTPEPSQSLEAIAADHATDHLDKTADLANDPKALAQVEQLWFRYPGTERPVLRGINLPIQRGEVVGLIGPSGAGKSTLCLCIAGIAPRATGGELTGRITIDGHDPQAASAHQTASKVSLMLENPAAQLTQVRPLDEVASVLMNRGQERDKAREMAREWLDRVGVPRQLHERRSWELSEGEQRMVVLAATLALDASLVVLDGVTDRLDEPGLVRLRGLLDELGRDKAVVIVDDDPDLLLDVADRVAVLCDGALLALGPPEAVLADKRLQSKAGFELPLRAKTARDPEAKPIAGIEQLRGRNTQVRAGSLTGRPAPAQPLLQMRNVSYCYGDGTLALDGVELSVAAGEALALIGPNGAGKSTLAKIAGGLLSPAKGSICIKGRNAADLSVRERGTLAVLAFPDPDQYISERTVIEEIAFPLRRDGMNREEAKRHATEAARRVGIDDAVLGRDPTALPLGLRKQVVMAAALVRKPRLVVLDEPALGLDARQRRSLVALLESLKAEGVALLILDHRADVAIEVADRAALIKAGRILAEGDPHSLFGKAGWSRLREADVAPPLAAQLGDALGLDVVRRNELFPQPENA